MKDKQHNHALRDNQSYVGRALARQDQAIRKNLEVLGYGE